MKSKKNKVLAFAMLVVMICSSMTAMASELKEINITRPPLDVSGQPFTTLEGSILIPSSEGIVEFSKVANATVTGDGVRLRAHHSLSSDVRELMYVDERVWYDANGTTHREEDGIIWYPIYRISTGDYGWADSDLIQPDFQRK